MSKQLAQLKNVTVDCVPLDASKGCISLQVTAVKYILKRLDTVTHEDAPLQQKMLMFCTIIATNMSMHSTHNSKSEGKVRDTVGLTKEKVGKVATVLHDVKNFFGALIVKYEAVWTNVPIASQIYRRTFQQADLTLLSSLEGHSSRVWFSDAAVWVRFGVTLVAGWSATRDMKLESRDDGQDMGYEYSAMLSQLATAHRNMVEAAKAKAEEARKQQEAERKQRDEELAKQEQELVALDKQARCITGTLAQSFCSRWAMHPVSLAQDMETEHALQASLEKMKDGVKALQPPVEEEECTWKPVPGPTKTEEELAQESATAKTQAIFDACVLPCDEASPPPTEASASMTFAAHSVCVCVCVKIMF